MSQLRVAIRSLGRTPLVTAVAVLSLALGMGANAAIFSIYERVLVRPLPVPEPERLVNLLAPGPKMGSQSSGTPGDADAIWSYPMFRDLERAELPLDGIAAEVSFGANLAYGGNNLSGTGAVVSGGYFETLGLRPALGRLFARDDDRNPGGHPLVVLDHGYWQRRFGGSPDVLGKRLVVNGQPLEVVGVLPAEWIGRTRGLRPQVYVPLTHHARVIPGRDTFEERRVYWLYVFGRLAPGTSLAEATAAVDAVYRPIVREVELPLQEGASPAYREQFAAKGVALERAAGGQSTLHEDVRRPLTLLLGVTALVLLIAAANIANLLLVRATARAGEISVRLSLGARRHQLVALLLTESFLLALAGGALGFGVAQLTLRLFRWLLPAESDVRYLLALDPRSGLFLGVLVAVVSLAGLFPALHSTRRDLATAIRSQGRVSSSAAANRFRTGMATLQVALSLTLMVAAGLFLRSLANVRGVDLGMEIEHLATFGVSPELNGLPPERSRALFARLEETLGALPGVTGVGASRVPLVADSSWSNNVSVQGYEPAPDADSNARFSEVGPGFFRTLGIPLLAGRDVVVGDAMGTPRVAVVNQAFVEKFGLGGDAVGSRMAIGTAAQDALDIEIVGVVGDAKYNEVKGEIPPIFYLPWRQSEDIGSLNFYVASAGDPRELLATLRRAVGGVAPDLPLENLATMEVRVRENVFLDRLLSALSAGFAVLATLLAGIGLYGVLAYGVMQRTHEIGVRQALGADAAQVRALVLRQVARIAGVGAALGLLAGAALGRLAGAVLYELDGNDPATFAAALLFLAVVALVAGMVPAMRAARIQPMVALRSE